MSRLTRTRSPLAVLAAALVAVFATMTGGGDPGASPAPAGPGAPIAAAISELLFIADRFEDQKRNASGEELPAQF